MNALKILTTYLTLITLTSPLLGQTTSSNEIEKPFIEVTGTAEKQIIPDKIFIGITIRERLEGKNKISIEEQEKNLKAALLDVGIDLKQLSLAMANANYIKVKWSRKDVIAKNEYILEVKNATTVGRVYEKLDELKILDAKIVRVDHSRMDEFKKEVRIMAIQAAKEKADYLLEAINEQTGKPLVIQEINAFPRPFENQLYAMSNRVNYRNFEDNLVEEPKNEMNIEFTKLKLQSSIYAKFEIK